MAWCVCFSVFCPFLPPPCSPRLARVLYEGDRLGVLARSIDPPDHLIG